MSDWYVFDAAGAHRGPLSSEAIAEAIDKGDFGQDVLIAADGWFEAEPGASGWQRAEEIEEIAKLVAISAERKARKLRVVPGGFSVDRRGTPDYGATVMMVSADASTTPLSKKPAPPSEPKPPKE